MLLLLVIFKIFFVFLYIIPINIMKKELKNITEEEIKIICELYGEPYIDFMAGKWEDSNYGLVIVK